MPILISSTATGLLRQVTLGLEQAPRPTKLHPRAIDDNFGLFIPRRIILPRTLLLAGLASLFVVAQGTRSAAHPRPASLRALDTPECVSYYVRSVEAMSIGAGQGRGARLAPC